MAHDLNATARKPILRGRSGARELLLQVLYEADLAGKDPADLVSLRAAEVGLIPDDIVFINDLNTHLHATMDEIDRKIAFAAPKRPLAQLAVIDRALLRLATAELLGGDTPVAVAIDEAVGLAKRYGSEASARFVNGVLGTIQRDRDHKPDSGSETQALTNG